MLLKTLSRFIFLLGFVYGMLSNHLKSVKNFQLVELVYINDIMTFYYISIFFLGQSLIYRVWDIVKAWGLSFNSYPE